MADPIPSIIAKRGCLDHDMFTDHAGRIYFVLGHYQPRDRAIALLKYVPDSHGTWVHKVSGRHYARSYWHEGIEAFESASRLAAADAGEEPAAWQSIDPVFGTPFLEVPHDRIAEYLLPEDRLRGILESRDIDLDDLERKVKQIVYAVLAHARDADLVAEDVGVTGSLLWRGHSGRSDINLNVYGAARCRDLERVLASLARRQVVLARGLTVHFKSFGGVPGIQVAGDTAKVSLDRKPKLKLDGFVPGIQIRWCLKQGEFPVVYGSEAYIDRGLVTIKARVIDDRFTLFFPSLVGIETLEGDDKPERVLVYDSRYTRLLREGDVVEITALLQGIKGSSRSQLLIGSRQHASAERVVFLDAGHDR